MFAIMQKKPRRTGKRGKRKKQAHAGAQTGGRCGGGGSGQLVMGVADVRSADDEQSIIKGGHKPSFYSWSQKARSMDSPEADT